MILVTGARGVVGRPLCERLEQEGRRFISVSRAPGGTPNCIAWDLNQPLDADAQLKIEDVTTVIHCAPIWLLPNALSSLRNTSLKRVIVFSSTSVISKVASGDSQELELVQQLATAEQALTRLCDAQGWALTVLRPTLIYGYQRDQNVNHIAQFVRRFGVMVLVGRSQGKRQPVHADDLVATSLSIIDNESTFGKVYNLGGGETLTYRAMVERIFLGLGKKPRIVTLPLWVFRPALKFAALIGPFSYTPEMANRMAQDLTYDMTSAVTDFEYAPQRFLLNPAQDIGATES